MIKLPQDLDEDLSRRFHEAFSCLIEARVLIEDWRQDYSHHRPHSALGMKAPVVFGTSCQAEPEEAARASVDLHSPYGLAPVHAGAATTLQSPPTHQLSQQVDR
jgi:transposase InsO family protein